MSEYLMKYLFCVVLWYWAIKKNMYDPVYSELRSLNKPLIWPHFLSSFLEIIGFKGIKVANGSLLVYLLFCHSFSVNIFLPKESTSLFSDWYFGNPLFSWTQFSQFVWFDSAANPIEFIFPPFFFFWFFFWCFLFKACEDNSRLKNTDLVNGKKQDLGRQHRW